MKSAKPFQAGSGASCPAGGAENHGSLEPQGRMERGEVGKIARGVTVEGQSLEAVQRETGCGHLCTACLPDLRDHLAARR